MRKIGIPLDDDKLKEISSLFNKGMSRKNIAKKLNVAITTVYRHTPKPKEVNNKKRDDKIRLLYSQGIKRKDIEIHMKVSKSIIQRALVGQPRQKITREHIKKEPIPTVKKKDPLNKEIKKLLSEGKTLTKIASQLKVGFQRVKQAVIDMGLDYGQIDILENIDRHTGRVKVKLDHKTWAYMDSDRWDCENKFREFKIKQLRL